MNIETVDSASYNAMNSAVTESTLRHASLLCLLVRIVVFGEHLRVLLLPCAFRFFEHLGSVWAGLTLLRLLGVLPPGPAPPFVCLMSDGCCDRVKLRGSPPLTVTFLLHR